LKPQGKISRHRKIAVRKRVQSVETEIGSPAFRVMGRPIVLTEAGSLYLLARPLSHRPLTVKSRISTRLDHDQKLISDFVELALAESAVLRTHAN
jgi:hypothetical protein